MMNELGKRFYYTNRRKSQQQQGLTFEQCEMLKIKQKKNENKR